MKDLGVNCFRSRALRYDGQVGVMKIDFAEIPRIKKSAFSMGVNLTPKKV